MNFLVSTMLIVYGAVGLLFLMNKPDIQSNSMALYSFFFFFFSVFLVTYFEFGYFYGAVCQIKMVNVCCTLLRNLKQDI